MKKLISLILASILLMSCFQVVMAVDVDKDYDEAIGLLAAIEILPTEININQSVTRADFAVYVARMFGVNDFAENLDRYYIDVPMDHYALTAINYLTERNIVSGNGAEYFYPDNTVSGAEACKILIEAAGYGDYAKALGEYPTGYIRAAQRFEIIDSSFDSAKQLTVAEAAELIFNAITAEYSEVVPADSYSLSAHSEGTILEIYHDIYIVEGIVEATNEMAVYEDNILESDLISVAGKKLNNAIPSKTAVLLGEYVNAYYYSDDKGVNGELIYLYADPDETDSFTITNKSFSRINENSLYYYDEVSNKDKTVSLDKAYFVVYNGSPYTKGSNADVFNTLGDGTITFKNSDGKGGYDVVIIESAEDFYVSLKNETTLTINDIKLSNKSYDLNKYENVEIYNADDTEIEFADIPAKSILSVYEAVDGRIIKFVVSTKTVTGMVESSKISDGEKIVKVGKENYIVTKNAEAMSSAILEPGANLTFYINSFGKISLFEVVKPGKAVPGYLVDMSAEDKIFSSRLMLKLCDSTGKVQVLYCDDEVEIDTVEYDDVSKAMMAIPNYNGNNGKVTPQIIAYETNSEGVVTKIDTTVVGPEETSATSLTRNIKFGDVVVYGTQRLGLMAVIDPANTLQYLVPDDDRVASAKNEDFSVGAVTMSDTGYYSSVESYRLRGDNVFEDVIVRKDQSAFTITYSNTIMLVEEVSEVLDAEGFSTIKISGFMKGSPVSYMLDSDCIVTDHNDEIDYTIADIASGDTVRVGEANGIVGIIEMIYDYSKGGKPDWIKVDDVNWYKVNASRYYWDQQQISFGYVSNIKESIVEISYKNDMNIDEVYNQLGTVMIYDKDAPQDKVYVGNISDIRDAKTHGTENCSKIIFQTYQGRYQGVVVYR